jgi:hypothetical protein
MRMEANQSAERLAHKLGKIGVAGSDSHTLAGIARTYTQVPGARNVDEYFAGLRAGRGIIHGEHGAYGKLTLDVCRFGGALLKENPWAAAILPLSVFMPLITLGYWFNEIRFCKKWAPRLLRENHPPHMLWDFDSRFEANWAR